MDYPRILVAEWNLGIFPDTLEFQSWKGNFRTEVSTNSLSSDHCALDQRS